MCLRSLVPVVPTLTILAGGHEPCLEWLALIILFSWNRFLVEHGADIAAVNNEGELPLDLAEEDEMDEYLQDQLRKASE
jgi:ankyrin repeat protein